MDRSLNPASLAATCSNAMSAAAALDWIAVSPNGKKVLVDNEHVRVVDATFAPGVPEPVHTHPAHVAYVIDGGAFRVDYMNGSSETLEAAAGDTYWFDPDGPHTGVNPGRTPVRALIIELKHLPYRADKA